MYKNRIRALLLTLLLTVFLSGCVEKESFLINGLVTETIEVGSDYVDPGVTMPEKYNLIITGEVDADHIGTYKRDYEIYTDNGEHVKTLSRFVIVKDSQPPTYTANDNQVYYAGINYTVDDFILDYQDNYDSVHELTVESNRDLVFNESGIADVTIIITDKSGNSNEFYKPVEVIFDFEKLISSIYADQSYKVNKGTTGVGSSYITVTIDSNTSISYFSTGSIHFLKSFTSNLGTRSSIQISAKYGEFDKASLNYHISGKGSSYSVGFLTFDATNDYTTLEFDKYDNMINNLALKESDMLNEMNPKVLDTLNLFIRYFNLTLNLKLK